MTVAKSEFHLEDEYQYNRSGPVRWILSHVFRYPWLPIVVTITAVINNFAYSYNQVIIGGAFDLINSSSWETQALLMFALAALAVAITQAVMGLVRNWSNEVIAQRKHHAEETGETFDPSSVTGGETVLRIRGLGAEIPAL